MAAGGVDLTASCCTRLSQSCHASRSRAAAAHAHRLAVCARSVARRSGRVRKSPRQRVRRSACARGAHPHAMEFAAQFQALDTLLQQHEHTARAHRQRLRSLPTLSLLQALCTTVCALRCLRMRVALLAAQAQRSRQGAPAGGGTARGSGAASAPGAGAALDDGVAPPAARGASAAPTQPLPWRSSAQRYPPLPLTGAAQTAKQRCPSRPRPTTPTSRHRSACPTLPLCCRHALTALCAPCTVAAMTSARSSPWDWPTATWRCPACTSRPARRQQTRWSSASTCLVRLCARRDHSHPLPRHLSACALQARPAWVSWRWR
jgi:hypothetical protein